MKELLRNLTPPFAWRAGTFLRRRLGPSVPAKTAVLFDGQSAMFLELIAEAKAYGEYGVGSSTLCVIEKTSMPVLSVDTSQEWIEDVSRRCGPNGRIDLRWVDLGPLAEWGMPVSYVHRDRLPDYLRSIWERHVKPDLVLIDGRFRVACFMQSLIEAAPGSFIVFDDYTDRPHYHIVEEVLKPDRVHGRQAAFLVPDRFDRGLAETLRERFLYVRD